MRAGPARAAVALLALWLVYSLANTHSVARFRAGTVSVLALALPAVLAVLAWTRRDGLGVPPRPAISAALVGVAVGVETVRYFSYLPPGVRSVSAHLVAGAALGCAALWLLPRRFRDAAVWLAGGCLLVTSYLAIRYDPLPRIDVWYSLDQGVAGLVEGRNPYEQVWYGGPGVSDAFTYLPMTAVLLAPFREVLGDVRWGMTAALLLAGFLLTRLRPAFGVSAINHERMIDAGGGAGPAGGEGDEAGLRRGRADARGAVLLLWLTPGQLVQTEQAWTEPLVLCLVVSVLWFLDRGRAGAAVAVLAVAFATKQHLALLLPTLALWRPVGPARALAAVAGAGALCLPFLLWSPTDFVRDTVTLLLGYPPLPLSPNLYIAASRAGWAAPFWLTGLIVLVALVGTAVAVRRTQPSPSRLALWWAVLLLTINLVNKQAFYNQFWLVGSLLLVSLAWPHERWSHGSR